MLPLSATFKAEVAIVFGSEHMVVFPPSSDQARDYAMVSMDAGKRIGVDLELV